MSCVSPRKWAKALKSRRDRLFSRRHGFRADRAAASDIVVCVAADDLRHFTAALAHQMPVYASSACLGRNASGEYRAASAPLFLGTSEATTAASTGGWCLF